MNRVLLIALMGGFGSVLRYWVATGVQIAAAGHSTGFVYGTLVVNVLGSLLIGFLSVYLGHVGASAETRAAITVGLLGGFTTFSAFAFETATLMRAQQHMAAFSHVLLNNALSIAAALAGWRIGERFFGITA